MVERPFIGGDRVDREGVLQYLGTGQFLLLEESNALVGCVYLEKQQGKGLGRKLMAEAEEYARNSGCLAMDLRTISPRTDIQPFYEHLGYTVTGISPTPADAVMKVPARFIHMSKPLQKARSAR